jgi:hypothetical protein
LHSIFSRVGWLNGTFCIRNLEDLFTTSWILLKTASRIENAALAIANSSNQDTRMMEES